MPRALEWLYRRLGKRYFLLYVVFELASGALITLATVGLFALYENPTSATFWRVVIFAELWVAVAMIYALHRTKEIAMPLVRWVGGGRDAAAAPEAWRRAVSLPREVVIANGWQPFAIVGIPIALFFTIELDLPWYSALVIYGVILVAVAYAAVLHFFVSEMFLRPVVEDITARLPSDWSDLYAEVELDSTDFLDRGALLLAPTNPARIGSRTSLRFRAARRSGYGVAAEMARRCLERLDSEGITGSLRAIRVLSDTDVPASTPSQGPVFRIGGRAV
jgi:hypothetical protein